MEEIEKIKVQIEELTMSQVDQSIVHSRVECDGCGMAPIVGPRYKCSICKNFDFCAKCEEFSDHQHAFLKITDPEVVPEIMISAVHEPEHEEQKEESSRRTGFKKVAQNWVDFAKNFIKRHHQADQASKQQNNDLYAEKANELVAIGIATYDESLAALKLAQGNMDLACSMILNKNV